MGHGLHGRKDREQSCSGKHSFILRVMEFGDGFLRDLPYLDIITLTFSFNTPRSIDVFGKQSTHSIVEQQTQY